MSDWSAPQRLDIPANKLVIFNATHQAAYQQYIQIIDSNNQPINFQNFSGSTFTFPISGSGTGVNLFGNGNGKFIMQAGYQIQFRSSGGKVPLVAASTTQFTLNGVTYGGGIMFVTDDQGTAEPDYNDTALTLQWFSSQG
ncbi:hypothetical protein ACFOEE_06600 [Pseudoalteromonas fenneropenaei]|uniref:Calcium-mediated lectin domain-containing protein n=1 Tax=Pseudoalteromonas fenneropenaei TaxID=1737459 RepID=A0ABV7CHX7_9GAMM